MTSIPEIERGLVGAGEGWNGRLTFPPKDVTLRRPIAMRSALLLAPMALALLAPALSHAQAATPGPSAPSAPTSPPTRAPVVAATPASAPVVAAAPGPRSRAVAIPIEILSPVGGAGCFYQRRILSGVVVTAGSLIAGGTMLWGVTHGDRDATIINAVAYGLLRAAGVFVAAQPTAVLPGEGSLPPATSGEVPQTPGPAGKTIGLWPRFTF